MLHRFGHLRPAPRWVRFRNQASELNSTFSCEDFTCPKSYPSDTGCYRCGPSFLRSPHPSFLRSPQPIFPSLASPIFLSLASPIFPSLSSPIFFAAKHSPSFLAANKALILCHKVNPHVLHMRFLPSWMPRFFSVIAIILQYRLSQLLSMGFFPALLRPLKSIVA